jgi:microcystin-dependent protein
VNAGTYPVAVSAASPEYSGTASGTLVISKGAATLTLGALFQNYDGTARRAVAVTVPSGLPWSVTYNGGSVAPTNIGLYTVVGTITHSNYTGSATGTLAVRASNPGNRPPATPQPPSYLNHQGFLADAQGVPLGSPNPKNYDILFRLYDGPVGGSSLWTERQVVTVDQGRYSVMLGEGQSFGVEPWPSMESILASGTGTARHLQVTVRGIGLGGSDIVMMPRYQLVSSPYAFLASHAKTADTLVDSNGVPVVRVSGNSVGVSVEQPNAGLDVGGTLTATTLATPGNAKVGGVLTASSFSGGGTLPLGGILVWAGDVPPQGWALCDGRTVNGRKTPDLRGRFIVGQGHGAGLTARVTGQIGGAEAYALAASQVPGHSHLFDPPPTASSHGGGHEHSYQSHSVARGNTPGRRGENWGGYTKHSWTTGNVNHSPHRHAIAIWAESEHAGADQPHTAMPPFYTLAYIMRVQ